MTQVTLTATGSWTAPAGVTSALIQCWAEGGNGGTGLTGGSSRSGGGGGGGEFASDTVNLTPGHNYSFTIGSGGSAVDTSFPGDNITVTAHHGGNASGTGPGAAGTGSTNGSHFNGGTAGSGIVGSNEGGGGGGGGAGSGGAGGGGGPGAANGHGAGGAAGTPDGGAGGTGGNGAVTGNPGADGSVPGGGGGGGSGRTAGTAGGSGARGQIIITYTVPVAGAASWSGSGTFTAAGTISGTITAAAAWSGTGLFTAGPGLAGGGVVNQWSVSFSQPAQFGTTPPALQSAVVGLNSSYQVGPGTGVPSQGNWLFAVCGWNQDGLDAATVGIADDIHSFWRPGNETNSTWTVSPAAGGTRTTIWYTPNIARVPQWVYAAPSGAMGALSVLVFEVAGLSPWDTVTGVFSNFASAATSLGLTLGAPSANAYLVGAVTGDNTSAGQAFHPSGWFPLATVSTTNGVDHTADAVLTTATVTTTGSVSVSGTASSAVNLSGAVIGILASATSPVVSSPHGWAGNRVILEAALGAGYETPADERTWTALSDSAWSSLGQGYKRFWGWQDSTGVPYALGQYQSSSGAVQLDNFDGGVSASNPASLFYTSAAGWSPQAAFYDPLIAAGGPLAWWKLADAAGSGTAADSSGNGHAGTPSSVTFGNASEAIAGNTSASFASASSSHVATSYNPGPLAAVTVEAWVNLNGLSQGGSNPRLAANSHTDSDHNGFQLMVTSAGQPQFWVGNGTAAGNAAGGAVPASGWTHLCGTYDGSTISIYVNGVLKTASSFTGTVTAGSAAGIGLGYNPAYNGDYVNGLLAEVAVFGSALTSQQVAGQYTAGPSATGVPVRLRMALGTIAGVTYNRWYSFERNTLAWPEKRNKALRNYVEVTTTDIWSVTSGSCPSPYRAEIEQDNPGWWWPCDDQPLAGGVQPTSLRNAANGSTTALSVIASPSGVTAGDAYSTTGTDLTATGTSTSTPPLPSVAVAAVGQQQGWMFGDPQSSPQSGQTGNPVTSNPGSAAWQQTGLLGNSGSNTWFLAATDTFPLLASGCTVKGWFNAGFLGTSQGYTAPSLSKYAVAGQPYSQITLCTLATASAPVAILYLDLSGHLILQTFSGGTGTTHTIYSGSDLRSASWHSVDIQLTQTTWTVLVDGGLTATVSGTASSMTSAWTWFTLNGDYGTAGGSSPGSIRHGGNVAYSHWVIFPGQLPAWRFTAHYAAAITAFGLLPAPQSLGLTKVASQLAGQGYTPDASEFNGSYGSSGAASSAYSFSALAVAAAGPYTSGPSARVAQGGYGTASGGQFWGDAVWVSWTSLCPQTLLYTAAAANAETEASAVAGSGESYTSGFGGSASGHGVAHVSGGTGAAPPAAASPLGDTVSARIERVLGYGGVTAPARAVDSSAMLLVQAATDVGGQQVGANIQNLVDSDNGFLFVDQNNTLCYRARDHLNADTVAWFIGMNVLAGMVPFDDTIEWQSDPQRIWDAITVQPFSPDGASLPLLTPSNATAADAAQQQFGVRPKPVTSYLQDAAAQQSQADWLLSSYGVLRRRASVIAVDAASHPAAWGLWAGLNPADIIQVYDAPFGQPPTTGNYRVSQIQRALSNGANGQPTQARMVIVADPVLTMWS